MSQFNKDPNFMSTSFILPRFFLALIIFGSLVFGGCSYIPWMDNDDMDDLAFEEDFPLDDEQAFNDEDDGFFDDDKNLKMILNWIQMKKICSMMILLVSTKGPIKTS